MDQEQRRKKREYMRRWRAAHPENREYQRNYNATYLADPDRAQANRERAAAWLLANPERAHRRSRDHYEQNRERYAALQRAYVDANREWHRLYQRGYQSARRARKAAVTIGKVDYDAIFAQANGVCALCQLPLGDDWHFDHIIPLARGGPHSQDNLQVAHGRCNLRKGARINWSPPP